MSAQHTPGRLRADGAAVLFPSNAGGFDISYCPNPIANARRLVACWNACEGIDTETLETTGGAAVGWARTSSKLLHATTQRNELLAALKAQIDAHAVPSTVCKERAAYEQARAAIAKAEGGAA